MLSLGLILVQLALLQEHLLSALRGGRAVHSVRGQIMPAFRVHLLNIDHTYMFMNAYVCFS